MLLIAFVSEKIGLLSSHPAYILCGLHVLSLRVIGLLWHGANTQNNCTNK